MIVGIKTERFITVMQHDYGFQAWGIERSFELHATKGWRPLRTRRQFIGPSEWRDRHRARTQGKSVTFKSAVLPACLRDVPSIPITEKMMMRHRERRRDIRIAANIARNAEEDRLLREARANV